MADPVTVAELVEISSWGLEVLAGAGGLDRRVSWASVFDVADPSGWVDGGDLVIITGHQFPESAADQMSFLHKLERRHSSGLALGTLGPAITGECVAEADRLAFPMLRVPRETAYLPIIKYVAAGNAGEVQRNLLTAIRIFETLGSAQEGKDPAHRFQHIERITGFKLYLVTPQGKALLRGFEDLPDELVRDVRRTSSADPQWKSLAIPGGFACPVRAADRVAGFLVAQESPARPAAGLSTFRHIETMARLDVANLYRQREVGRRKGAELLAQYLQGAHPRPAEPKAGNASAHEPGHVIASVAIEVPASDSPVDREVHHQLADHGVRHMLLTERDRIILALHVSDLPHLEEVSAGLPIRVGVSCPRRSLADAAVARREAVWAERHGRIKGGGRLRYFLSQDEWTQWLRADPEALGQMVQNTLGPVIDYDAKRDADLLVSLETYFAQDARLQAAADLLHIHKHTLAYRLRRVEQLTGRDLNSVRDRAQLWLALSAYEVVNVSTRKPRSS